MQQEVAVVPEYLICDPGFRFLEGPVPNLWYPFGFLAPEESLHRTVIPAVATPTHAPLHLVTHILCLNARLVY